MTTPFSLVPRQVYYGSLSSPCVEWYGCCISLIKATFLSYCFVGKKRKMAWNAVPLCLFWTI